MKSDISVLSLLNGLTESQAKQFRERALPTLAELRRTIILGTEKEYNNKMDEQIKIHLASVRKRLEDVVKAREQMKAKIAELDTHRYSDEHIQEQTDKFTSEFQEFSSDTLPKVTEDLEKLRVVLEGKHSELDLNSPALTNALSLIETAGPQLPAETVRQIVQTAAGNIPALKLLRSVFQSKGMLYDGGISNMIYTPSEAIDSLERAALEVLVTGQVSINHLSSDLSKLAKLEGIEQSAVVDEQRILDVTRAAAGL